MVPPPPPCGVVWLWVASPSLWWCLVVGEWVCLGWFPHSPLWCGVGLGFLRGSAWRVSPRVEKSVHSHTDSAWGAWGGGVAEENQVYLEATVRQIFTQQLDKLFVVAALPPCRATLAGALGCTKLLSVFAAHAFLSRFCLSGSGFTIHSLDNKQCL